MGLLINCGNFNVCIIKWFYKIVFILIGKKINNRYLYKKVIYCKNDKILGIF